MFQGFFFNDLANARDLSLSNSNNMQTRLSNQYHCGLFQLPQSTTQVEPFQ